MAAVASAIVALWMGLRRVLLGAEPLPVEAAAELVNHWWREHTEIEDQLLRENALKAQAAADASEAALTTPRTSAATLPIALAGWRCAPRSWWLQQRCVVAVPRPAPAPEATAARVWHLACECVPGWGAGAVAGAERLEMWSADFGPLQVGAIRCKLTVVLR